MAKSNPGYWVSAKQVAHYRSYPIPKADVPTFQILNGTWAKDRKNVYSVGQRIAKADTNTFQVLNGLFAKDANHAYYLGGIIKDADAASFQALDSGVSIEEYHNGFGDLVRTTHDTRGYAGDSQKVFHYVETMGKPCVLTKADRETFVVLGHGYGRDRANVFFEKWHVKGADPNTFEVIPPLWAKDRKSAYYGGSRLPGADPESFSILSSHDYLTRDATHFYDRSLEISESQAFPHGSSVPGYPLSWVHDVTKAADYLRRGATPHDRLALNSACRTGDVEMVRLLLSAGCNPRITDAGGNSCLTELGPRNDLEIAKLLIEAGAEVNHAVEYTPETHGPRINASAIYHPLQHAVFLKRFELADFLISVGANVHALTGEGDRLIDYFRKLDWPDAVAYLRNHGAFPLR